MTTSSRADRRDELGDLSRAFNTMTTDLKQVTASKTELENEIAERRQAEAERERLMEELSSQNARLARREEELEAQNEALREAEEALQEGANDCASPREPWASESRTTTWRRGPSGGTSGCASSGASGATRSITYETFLAGVHPDDREAVSAAVDAAMGSEGPHEAYYRVINRADGRERWVHANWQVSLEDGRAGAHDRHGRGRQRAQARRAGGGRGARRSRPRRRSGAGSPATCTTR